MTPKRKKQFRKVLMAMAGQLATMSLATRSKVGALIVKKGNIKSVICGKSVGTTVGG